MTPDPTDAELDKWEAQMGEHIGHPVPRLIKALRACRKEAEADGFKRGQQEGLEAALQRLSAANPIWRKAAMAAIRDLMEKPDAG